MTAETGIGEECFYGRVRSRSLGEVAACAGGSSSLSDLKIDGLASLVEARPNQVTFAYDRKYLPELRATQAGAVIVLSCMQFAVPARTAAIVVRDPYASFVSVAKLFYPPTDILAGRDPTAAISSSAEVDRTAAIGAHAIVCNGAKIAENVRVEAHCVVGPGVTIGRDSHIGAHVSLQFAHVGAGVVIHAGARIGERGFGFACIDGSSVSVPHLGRVLIGDGVEIGANTTVDRGSFQDTVIGEGTKIDNLVQIAHNVHIGRNCIVVAQTGVAGSCVIEDNVRVGGQVAIAPHTKIGRAASIGAQSGVMTDVPAFASVLGTPAVAKRTFFKQVAMLRRMVDDRRIAIRTPPIGAVP